MIIVDAAQKLVNTNVDVVVTSVLQTTAGRMIFTELKEVSERKKSAGDEVYCRSGQLETEL